MKDKTRNPRRIEALSLKMKGQNVNGMPGFPQELGSESRETANGQIP